MNSKVTQKLIASYCILIILSVAFISIYRVGAFEERVQYIEFMVNIIDVISSSIIFYNIRNQYKSFIILPLCMFLLLLMDIVYLIMFYFKYNNLVIYALSTYSWYIFTILGLVFLLLKFVYEIKESYFLLLAFASIALVIIFSFSPSFFATHFYYPYYSLDLSAHIIIFYLCVLLIIATQNKYVLLAIAGLCIVEISNFAMTECYLENNMSKLVYGEFCFFVGLFVMSLGMLNVIKHKLYNPELWFFKSRTIRNRFSFLFFFVCIWSFIIACIVMKQLGNITNDSLVFIPAIGMFYSMVMAVLSVALGKQIEEPFLLIQARIKSVFNGDKNSSENLNLIEFQKLNNFIAESYEYKKSLENHIVSTATRVAHDIKSPIQVIENLIKDSKNEDAATFHNQLIKQINKISYISKSLLKENKKIIDNDSLGYQSLYCIINELIQDKYIEWNIEDKVIDFIFKPQQIVWLDKTQAGIKSVLSNLLNNSFEASQATQLKIIISVELVENNIVINIQDYGCGIDEKYLQDIINGKSFKVTGNGIGLSSAKKFMTDIAGNMTIESKINQGTNIKLVFPALAVPQQFARTLNITTKNVVVVDDDTLTINFWQEYFLFKAKDKKVAYFLNYKALETYFLKNIKNNDDTTYLLDYNIFGEKLTGVDVIKKHNLKNVYLITNYAEDIKLQEEIKSLDIKLIPKSMLQIIQ